MEEENSIFEEIDVEIQNYIKNLLFFCGYDSLRLLSEMNSKRLNEIECYIREKMGNNPAYNSPETLKKFFGKTLITFEEIKTYNFNPGAKETILFHIPRAIKRHKHKNRK